ncbi:MAG TPA: LD-carboxypeptidase, partial [Cryomorphaceae bacterium]|nr:LD-carboxypeptidase [Cryomorphaceae bacterium]
MTSNTPPFLKKGDKITIVAPARAVEAAFIESAVATIEKAGYKAVTATNLFEKENQFAGSDESRAADLNAAIGDEECRAILCARGGYGTARLLLRIDWGAWAKDPKWLIGYSDVTALHSALHQLLGMQSVHGTMPVNFTANTPDALEGLFAVLRGEETDVTFEPHRLNRSGECVGDMVGGNLSVLYSMLGSETQLDTKGKILFLEDLDEYLYHVDRMMLA